jgi:hypothetical protein
MSTPRGSPPTGPDALRWLVHRLAITLILLAGCTAHAPPSAEQAAAGYLAVHNDRDRDVARALWGERADEIEALIGWFRAQVGRCYGFEPMRIKNQLDARYVFACERGELEVQLRVDPETGAVRHTLFGARGVEPPAEVRRAVEQLIARANDESAALPALAKRLKLSDVETQLAAIARHGQCRIDRVHLGAGRGARFVLECTEGSATVTLDLTERGSVRRFFVHDGAQDTWRRNAA